MKKLSLLLLASVPAFLLSIFNINNINKAKAEDDPFDFILSPNAEYYAYPEDDVSVSWGANYVVETYVIKYIDEHYEWQTLDTLTYNPVLEPNTVVSYDFKNPVPGENSVLSCAIESYNGVQLILTTPTFNIFWTLVHEEITPTFTVEPQEQTVYVGEYININWQLNVDTTGIKHKIEWFDNVKQEWELEGEVDGDVKDNYFSFAINPRNETTQLSFRIHLTIDEQEIYSNEFLAYWRGLEVETVLIRFDANGGTGEMEDYYHDKGADYYLPDCEFAAPDGMEFDCWGNGNDTYEVGDIIVGLDCDMLFCAMWKEIEKPVTPDKKGGCGGSIIATSVILTTLSFLGIGAVLLKKKQD